MNPSGILLVIAGFWVGAQVLGGDALQRLGIVASSGSSQPAPNVDPGTGVPNQDPSKPFLTDPRGRVY